MEAIEQETFDERAARPSLLSLLIENGVASEGELRLIVAEGMGAGVRLGEALLQRGWIDEPGLGRLLARQWGLPFVEEGSVDARSAADDALSRDRAHELRAFCSRAEDGSLRALVSDPSTDQLNEIRQELGDIGFAVITDRELRRLLRDDELQPVASEAAESPVEITKGAGDDGADGLLADLSAARERLEDLHGQVAEVLRTQEAASAERASLEAEVEQLRAQHEADQERIRELEQQCALETERHRLLVSGLTQLTATHTADE